MTEFALTYDDVTLVPNYSEIRSRKEPDPSCELMGFNLRTPILSANMDTITEAKMAVAMWKAGGIGILHRFMDIEKNCEEFQKVKSAGAECMVSIGAGPGWFDRAENLFSVGARHFVIDIAHGHSIMVRNVISKMRKEFGAVKIMAGNVATAEAVRDMKKWGADCVKVGIGGGSVCSTRIVTGFGIPMFSSVLECAAAADEVGIQLVADGGIKCSGDIVKALVAGADAVMVGKLLAGSDETPGEAKFHAGGPGSLLGGMKKEYKGMSSASARQRNGSTALAEGVDAVVEATGSVVQKIEDLTAGLKSGMSYAGAKNLSQMSSVRWVRQTPHGTIEGTPHILKG